MSAERPRCAVVGAANIDIGGFPSGMMAMRDSNPGRVRMSAGGVGRNIACNLARMGMETHLVTALGGDTFAEVARADCRAAGVMLEHALTFPEVASSVYLYIADAEGDMQLAVNDMGICDRLTPEALEARVDFLNAMDVVVLAETYDLCEELMDVVESLPSGRYKRYRLCDQLNSIITARGLGFVFGTVE